MRHLLPLFASLALAACASLPPPPTTARDAIREFALEARFALRTEVPGQSPHSAGGRLSWSHDGRGDRILLANPLGIGIAEIDMTPARSTLRTADGRNQQSDDPDALIEDVTGQRLPVARLPGWLLGRGGDARIERDPAGRPLRLREAGWNIEYAYEDADADALPRQLTLSGDGGIELRLRIEEWRSLP